MEAKRDSLMKSRDGKETPQSCRTPGSRSGRSQHSTPPPSRSRSTVSEPASDADVEEDKARDLETVHCNFTVGVKDI